MYILQRIIEAKYPSFKGLYVVKLLADAIIYGRIIWEIFITFGFIMRSGWMM